MKRTSKIHCLIIVVILTIVPLFSLISNIESATQLANIEPSTQTFKLSQEDSDLNLTWTSRTQVVPLQIQNYSSAVGDHVVLNATFPESMNVTYCEMRIWNVSANVNVTASSNSSTITIDTYYLHHQNLTYNIHVIGNSTNNDTWIIYRQYVEICNFFEPHVIVPHPEALPIDERTYNITWSCTDGNEEEVNYYSIWISNNDGVSYYLIALNVTKTWFAWNSTGWLEDDYMVRVRAYSIDLSYPGLDLTDPPTGYLPGDFSDGFSHSFRPTGLPMIHNVRVQSVSDFAFYEGSTGNSIVWQFYFEDIEYSAYTVTIHYEIHLNGTLLSLNHIDLPHTTVNLSIPLDNLSAGIYNYTLTFVNPGFSGGEFQDTVLITVLPTTTTSDGLLLFTGLLIGLSVGVPIIILIVYAKIVRKKV